MKPGIPVIYPITDKARARKETHLEIIRELVRGGADLVQVRDKKTPVRALIQDLLRCADFCAGHGVRLIVNDRCDLALTCFADGVHLGQNDLPAPEARKLLGRKKLLGLSTHSLPQLRKARNLPVNYLGFGPVFTTVTKENSVPVVGLALLQQACQRSALPIIAIGGIGPDNLLAALEAGAAGVAIISALMRAPNLARQMERLLKIAADF